MVGSRPIPALACGFRLALIEFLFKLPLMLIGTWFYGIAGALVVRVATGFFVSGCSMLAVRELIRLPIWAQLLAPWRPTLSAIVMALAVMSMDGLLTNVNDHFHLILVLARCSCYGAWPVARTALSRASWDFWLTIPARFLGMIIKRDVRCGNSQCGLARSGVL